MMVKKACVVGMLVLGALCCVDAVSKVRLMDVQPSFNTTEVQTGQVHVVDASPQYSTSLVIWCAWPKPAWRHPRWLHTALRAPADSTWANRLGQFVRQLLGTRTIFLICGRMTGCICDPLCLSYKILYALAPNLVGASVLVAVCLGIGIGIAVGTAVSATCGTTLSALCTLWSWVAVCCGQLWYSCGLLWARYRCTAVVAWVLVTFVAPVQARSMREAVSVPHYSSWPPYIFVCIAFPSLVWVLRESKRRRLLPPQALDDAASHAEPLSTCAPPPVQELPGGVSGVVSDDVRVSVDTGVPFASGLAHVTTHPRSVERVFARRCLMRAHATYRLFLPALSVPLSSRLLCLDLPLPSQQLLTLRPSTPRSGHAHG